MNLSFKPGRITLVLGPFDMRCGFRKLALAASALLGIDITKGRDYVVFISKNRKIAKVIWCDNAGAFILNRRLNEGRFQKFVRDAVSTQTRHFTPRDLATFLDGDPLLRSANATNSHIDDNQGSSRLNSKDLGPKEL